MIAMVGLGNMGLAMARRIAARGHRTLGVDVAGERRALWERETGMPSAPDLTGLPAEVDRVLVMVRLTGQATEVLGALPDRPGLACYVSTTLEADTAERLGSFAPPSVRVVELPVSGGERGAADGTLTVLAAGAVTDADRAFLTGTIAARVIAFDRPGDATRAKLINNVTGAYNALVLARMLELAHASGLDPGRMLDVLRASSGGSWMAGALLTLRDDLLAKDVALLRATADLPAVRPDEGLAETLERVRDLLR